MDLSDKSPRTPIAATSSLERTKLQPPPPQQQQQQQQSTATILATINQHSDRNRSTTKSSTSSSSSSLSASLLDLHQNPEIHSGKGVGVDHSSSDNANGSSGAITGAIESARSETKTAFSGAITADSNWQEYQHYKQIIGERLKRLEQFIEHFRSIVAKQQCSSFEPTMMATATTEYRIDDLKTLLSEIDQHLSILKEIEQRNTIICETFSKEIRSRDEALLDKMKEITIMNQELATLQARMQHLVVKNTQLENEVKYLKTISSYTNTETSSTPIMANDEHGGLPRHSAGGGNGNLTTTGNTSISSSLFGALSKIHPLPPPPPMDGTTTPSSSKMADVAQGGSQQSVNNAEPMEKAGTTTANKSSVVQHPQKAAIYHDLLIQYRKIEQLIQQNEMHKLRDTTNSNGNSVNDHLGDDLAGKAENSAVIEPLAQDDDQNGQDADGQTPTTPATAVEKLHPESGPLMNTMTSMQKMASDVASVAESTGSDPDGSLLAPSSASPTHGNLEPDPEPQADHQSAQLDGQQPAQQDPEQSAEEPPATKEDLLDEISMVDNEDVVATSIKAYEHFVKMQHDLEILMRKESEYRSRIIELERENERLRQKVKDDEYNLSDVQYELEILKHNYELEIESFNTAINERETLIEGLQQKMQKLRTKYTKLSERLKRSEKIEVELQAKMEELQGRLKYEQLQKQALIDLRINDLEIKLKQQEHEYRTEIENLRTDLVCKESVCKELQQKIDDLEASLKSLTSAEFEDEFIYYKNQIDSLIKDLDQEKLEHQRCREHLEQELRNKEKLLEQAREQLKKEKDSRTREKTEHEQRMRKMMAKLKTKEEEIKLLHDKIVLLSKKFQDPAEGNPETPASPNADGGQVSDENQSKHDVDSGQQNDGHHHHHHHPEIDTKSPEQLLTELTLKEIKMNELNERLEEYEEQLKQLKEQLFLEHDRRRRLETFYLNTLNNNYNDNDDYWDVDADYAVSATVSGDDKLLVVAGRPKSNTKNDTKNLVRSHQAHRNQHHSNNGPYYRRDSTSSFALLMDESSTAILDKQMAMANLHAFNLDRQQQQQQQQQQQSYWTQTKRWLRRQKNIFLFGRTRAKLIRIIMVVYLIWLHYLAVDYYYLAKTITTTITAVGGATGSNKDAAAVVVANTVQSFVVDELAPNIGGFNDDDDDGGGGGR